MKSIYFSLWSLNLLQKAIGATVDAYVTTSSGISMLSQMQDLVDRHADEGQTARKLTLSMSIESNIFGGRWDSQILQLRCTSPDDVVAALVQPLLGEHFFATIGDDLERAQWRDEVNRVTSEIGFVAFDVLFSRCQALIAQSKGAQIWFANDCGIGESSIRDLIFTGNFELLGKIFKNLEKVELADDSYGFSETPSMPKWIEIGLL